MEPIGFSLGESAHQVSYRDFLLYRGALNALETSALTTGKPLVASLEVYAPLNDPSLFSGMALNNIALSLGTAYLNATDDEERIQHLQRKIEQANTARANELKVEYKQPIQLDPAIYKLYIGHYEISPGDFFVVETEKDILYIVDRGNRAELLPEADNKFFIRYPADLTVLFEKDEQGTVTGLVFSMNGQEMRAKKVMK